MTNKKQTKKNITFFLCQDKPMLAFLRKLPGNFISQLHGYSCAFFLLLLCFISSLTNSTQCSLMAELMHLSHLNRDMRHQLLMSTLLIVNCPLPQISFREKIHNATILWKVTSPKSNQIPEVVIESF